MINSDTQLLKRCLRQLLQREDLSTQRNLVQILASELNTDSTDCAAALLYLLQTAPVPLLHEPKVEPPIEIIQTPIKMLRYRLDVGSKHQVTQDELKKLLIEESGVDKNNIHYINIRDDHTIIELPDAMPPDIYQHLKTVEINQQKLSIKRVKSRDSHNKKRGSQHGRRGRARPNKTSHVIKK